jgi:urea transport system ATP-binding protein
MGLLPIRSGEILFDSHDLGRQIAEQRAPMGIGHVPPGRQIFPMLTVKENLRIGIPLRKDRSKQIPDFIFELFPVLKRLNREIGLTVLLVEQKLLFARKLADRFCILDRGRHVAAGEMKQLDDELIKQYLTV